MHGSDENQNTSLDLTNTSSFSTHMPIFNDGNEVGDVHASCHDHIKKPLEEYHYLIRKGEMTHTIERYYSSPYWRQEKRYKGKYIQAKNLHPHILSHEGYKALQKKLVVEQLKEAELQEVEIDASSIKVARHELWKRA
ncbi:hypothetical protein CR513_38166, partial [Mucuna pruriens]